MSRQCRGVQGAVSQAQQRPCHRPPRSYRGRVVSAHVRWCVVSQRGCLLPPVTIQNYIATQSMSRAHCSLCRAHARSYRRPCHSTLLPCRSVVSQPCCAILRNNCCPSATIQCFVSRLPLARPCTHARCHLPRAQASRIVAL